MIVKCRICGKEIEAKQRNHNICSDECRKINIKQRQNEWYECHKLEQREKARNRSTPREVKCKICGERVMPHLTATGKMFPNHYHEECIMLSAYQEIEQGKKITKQVNGMLKTAINHGYTKTDLIAFAKEKGLIADERKTKFKPCFVWRG
jgi:endogenous inhibitor of DNA gyrase (YacG/DUF329 family)